MTEWQRIRGSSEPRDQSRDLPGSLWAEVGPDYRRGWSWSILSAEDAGTVEIVSGFAATEHVAKWHVDEYERTLEVQ